MTQRNVRVGNISDVNGEVNIAAGDIYKGYTSDQVSVLLTQITSTFQPKAFDGHCPYKGLDVFEEEDAELFFGREKLIGDLVSRVKESRTVFITGPSGSGKSSLVRAGLIPALKQGGIENSERWLYETMKPGRDPSEALASMLSRLKSPELGNYFRQHIDQSNVLHECAESALSDRSDQRLVLFVDQFEEIFTQISNEAERASFLNLLTHAATTENGRVTVLFSMRSDFVTNCATYPQVNALLNQQFVQVGAMQPDELVSAIAQPALRVGLHIDPDLIAQIINDMQGEPGTLPLMQFALKDLFDSEQSKDGVIALMLNDYLQHGGIRKSLERHADDVFTKLTVNEQVLARSIFSGLIEIGHGTQDTRRTALFDELIPANTKAEDVEAIVEKLADARLITTDEQAGKDTVTISHEKLIDAWPWLKKLVNENRDMIALQNEIANDAKEWDENKRDASYLYNGARLATAHEQQGAKKLVLSGSAHEFVRAGSTQQKRRQMTTRLGAAAVGVALTVAVAVFSFQSSAYAEIAGTAQAASTDAVAQKATAQAASTSAVEQAEKAQEQSQISRAGELAAQSIQMRGQNFQLSLLLGIEAFRLRDTVRSRGALLGGSNANPQLVQILMGHTDSVSSIAFSPDGRTLASGSWDGTIILWDLASHQPIGRPLTGHRDPVLSVTFSPDGKTIASGSRDSTIILWDVASRQPIGQPLTGHTDGVGSVTFSPDGKTLASGSWDKTIILWDVETRQPIGPPLTGHTDIVASVAFSPDGKTLASGSRDDTIMLWDVETRLPIDQLLKAYTDVVHFGFAHGVSSVAFSPDGKSLASGNDDHTITLWDVASRQPIGQPLTGHTDVVTSVAFSPDGKTLASGSLDSTIILWDVLTALNTNVTSRQPIVQTLTGHTWYVNSIAFSPDGKTLASGSFDNTIILWEVTARQVIGQTLRGHTSPVSSTALSLDGNILASGSWDGAIILWDVKTHQTIGRPLIGHTDSVNSIAFSPDGKTLASGSNDHTIILWDVETHLPIGQPLKGHTSPVYSIAFSQDGKTLASAGSWDKSIILWNVETRQPISQHIESSDGAIRPANTVSFSSNAKTLARGDYDTIILWDVETLQPVGAPLSGDLTEVSSVAFSPDGKTLASGSYDSTITLWDVASRQPIGQLLSGYKSVASSVAFSPDGKTLASGGYDNTITLWDVASRQPIGQPLIGHTDWVYSVAFSPDGKTLVSGSNDHTIILWNLNPQYWIEQSCQRVGRNFTRVEWAQYIPNEEYHRTCEQWPLESEATPTPSPMP